MCLAAWVSGGQAVWLLNLQFMLARFGQTHQRMASAAFTLAEVMIALGVFALVSAGLINGYIQSNRDAEWSAMSLAAQSYASQGVEQARSANCSVSAGYQLPTTNYFQTNAMQVPISGQTFIVTNWVTVANLYPVTTPYPLFQIRSDCYWQFPATNGGKWFTNTVITERAPDQ